MPSSRPPADAGERPAPVQRDRKRAEEIAGRIERDIELGGYERGDSLGTEPELLARYQVARETLRAAIRQLERNGIVEMRRGGRGGGGGMLVAEPTANVAVRTIAAHLELTDVTWPEILEARLLVEMQAIGTATERADAAGLARLRALAIELEATSADIRELARRELAIPTAIALLAGNTAAAIFSASLNLYSLDLMPAHFGTPEGLRTQAALIGTQLRAVVDAICACDRAGAERAFEIFASVSRRTAVALERRRREVAGNAPSDPRAGTADRKLGERVALAIASDIAQRHLPEGERLGSEPSLLERHRVSRAVLREAIRGLELHGLVRTRRGVGGGIVVARADPAYTIATAASFLHRAQVQPVHYAQVRKALAVGAAELTIARADAAAIQALVQAVRRFADVPPAHFKNEMQAMQELICAASGNRALTLLMQVVHAAGTSERLVLAEEQMAALRRNLADTVAAIADGDAGRAKRLQLQHNRLIARRAGPQS
ncbi:MAG: FadR/GntR family transcriptional regulator [Gammaproteobacteria bacterium]